MKENPQTMPTNAKAIIHHLPSASSCPDSFWAMAILEKLPALVLWLSMILYGMKYFFDQFRSTGLAVTPSRSLPTPSLLTEGTEQTTEKASKLCKGYLVIPKPTLCYQHCFGHKCKTLPAAVKKMNSIPTRPSTDIYKLPKSLESQFGSVCLQEFSVMAPTTL